MSIINTLNTIIDFNGTIHFLRYYNTINQDNYFEFQICIKNNKDFPVYNSHYFDVNNYYYNSEIFIRIFFGDDLQNHFDKDNFNLELFCDIFSEDMVIDTMIKQI
jgi:hypothetical protein